MKKRNMRELVERFGALLEDHVAALRSAVEVRDQEIKAMREMHQKRDAEFVELLANSAQREFDLKMAGLQAENERLRARLAEVAGERGGRS